MGGGGQSLSNVGGNNYWGGGMPLQGGNAPQQGRMPGGNQAQANYINAHGALPPGMGGTALNQGQQNFFANKGYLPPGFTGGENMGFIEPKGPFQGMGGPGGLSSGGTNTGGGAGSGWNPTGGPQVGGGWDISQAFQHLFGGNFGPYTNWMG